MILQWFPDHTVLHCIYEYVCGRATEALFVIKPNSQVRFITNLSTQ